MSPFYLICLEGQIFGFIQEKEPSIQDFIQRIENEGFVDIFTRISSMIKPPIFLQICDEDGVEEYNKLYIFQGGGILEFDPFFNDNDLVKRFLTED